MSIIVYEDKNYGGESVQLRQGDYSYTNLINLSAYGVGTSGDFHDNISSIRVSPGTLVLLSSSSSYYGGETRVVMGPHDIPDLSVIGLNDKISSLRVRKYKKADWGESIVVVYSQPNFYGKRKHLNTGEYNKTRLTTSELDESGISDNTIASIKVPANTIAILYDGPNFDTNKTSTFIIGARDIPDVQRINMGNKISSIRVYSVETPPKKVPIEVPDTRTGGSYYATRRWRLSQQYNDPRYTSQKYPIYPREYGALPELPVWARGFTQHEPKPLQSKTLVHDYTSNSKTQIRKHKQKDEGLCTIL